MSLHRAIAAALLCSAAMPATALRPDPLDATTAVPPLVHRSAFDSYRRLKDDKPVPWREANDTVGRIGGWRAYAREAQQSEPATPAASAPAARPGPVQPAAAGHDGHHKP